MVDTAVAGGDGSQQHVDVLSGRTFAGAPYKIVLERSPFKYGSSAKIRKGQVLNESITVAVKVLGGTLDDVRQELLIHELRIAREVSLRHQSILTFVGTVNIGEQEAIVSLYMHNGNMMDYMRGNPECDKKKLILQVAEAVAYLHGPAQLIHGDIKCSNVLISDSGDALLSDFGLSMFAEKSQPITTAITMIRRMNTLQFAAPELLIDQGMAPPLKTCNSDVYAFGMLVFEPPEAFFKRLPWPAQSKFSLINKVCSGKHPARPTIDGACVAISHSWWDTCLRCWSFNPMERPPIHDVLCALRATNPLPSREFYFEEDIITVAYLPDGKTMAGGSVNGSVVLYNTLTGHTRRLLQAGIDHWQSSFDLLLGVCPNGQRIACATGARVNVWDIASGVQTTSMEHSPCVTCIAFSPDGAYIASGIADGTVQLRDAVTGAATGEHLQAHDLGVTCISFAPDGQCVASGSSDGKIILRNSRTGASSGVLTRGDKYDDGPVFSICFSPGGTQLVAVYCRKAIIWDLHTEDSVRSFSPYVKATWCVAISPSTKCIATGSPRGEIRIWDTESAWNDYRYPLVEHGDNVRSLAFSPDGRTLASASGGRKIRVWDLF